MLKAFGWISLFLAIAALLGGGAAWYFLVPCWRCIITPNRYHRSPGNERASPTSLKNLTSAEADFRANDRDGNGKRDFWRKDVAGLYGGPGADGHPLKLIELSTAMADLHPVTNLGALGVRGPKNGYWYYAIRHEDEDPQQLDPQRFAYAAVPVDFPKHEKYVYIIDENYTIFRSDDPANLSVRVFPNDLSTWSKLD